MQKQIAESTDIRTIYTLISESKSLGLRVVHRPEIKTNVVHLFDAAETRRMQICASPEAA